MNEEKEFKNKLKEMGIIHPKILKSPSGIYQAYPNPGSHETWIASYYLDEHNRYHFEYVNDRTPKSY